MIIIPSSGIYVNSNNRGCHDIDIRKYIPLNYNVEHLALTFIPPGLVAINICVDCAIIMRFSGTQLVANKNLVEGHRLLNPSKSEYPIYLEFQYDMSYKYYEEISSENKYSDKLVYSDNECEFYDYENSTLRKGRKAYRFKEATQDMIIKAKVIVPSINIEVSKFIEVIFNHSYD